FAAGERHQQSLYAFTPALAREQAAILVIRVGDDHHQAAGGLELPKFELKASFACVLRKWIVKTGSTCRLDRRIVRGLRNGGAQKKEGNAKDLEANLWPDLRVCDLHNV